MANSPFIGTGNNPEGPDLPLGFGMRLAQEPGAMNMFGVLDDAAKSRIISYIQSSATGSDAENRIENAVASLRDGRIPS
jgi:uncharacterized protein YdeI (YjbR/CyaY-like superfamily)